MFPGVNRKRVARMGLNIEPDRRKVKTTVGGGQAKKCGLAAAVRGMGRHGRIDSLAAETMISASPHAPAGDKELIRVIG